MSDTLVNSGALDMNDVRELLQARSVFEVLHADPTLFLILLGHHCFDKLHKNVVGAIIVFSINHVLGISNAWTAWVL